MQEVINIGVENYRRSYNYSQERFANLIGKNRRTYALKEKGIVKFSPEEMKIIRDELRQYDKGLTIDKIFFEE